MFFDLSMMLSLWTMFSAKMLAPWIQFSFHLRHHILDISKPLLEIENTPKQIWYMLFSKIKTKTKRQGLSFDDT